MPSLWLDFFSMKLYYVAMLVSNVILVFFFNHILCTKPQTQTLYHLSFSLVWKILMRAF